MALSITLNPSKRGAKRKKPSAAQLAARARFVAMAKARAAKLNPKKRRKATKAKKRRAVKLNPVAPMSRKRKSSSRRRRSPLRIFRRKAHRNPILPRSFMDTHLQPAMIGAVGALANDVAVGKLVSMLPAGLQKPEVRSLVKGVAAIGLSMLASKAKVAGGSTIRAATVGALTCALHDAGRVQLQKSLPAVSLGEYLSEVVGPWQGMNAYNGGLGEYLSALPAPGYTEGSASYAESETVY